MEYAKNQQRQVNSSAYASAEKLGPRNNGPEQAMVAGTGWDGTATIDEKMWNDAAFDKINSSTSKAPARGPADKLGTVDNPQKQNNMNMWKAAAK